MRRISSFLFAWLDSNVLRHKVRMNTSEDVHGKLRKFRVQERRKAEMAENVLREQKGQEALLLKQSGKKERAAAKANRAMEEKTKKERAAAEAKARDEAEAKRALDEKSNEEERARAASEAKARVEAEEAAKRAMEEKRKEEKAAAEARARAEAEAKRAMEESKGEERAASEAKARALRAEAVEDVRQTGSKAEPKKLGARYVF